MRVEKVLKQLVAEELCATFSDWTQMQVSVTLGISQGDVSLIRGGKLRGFSASRLLRYLVQAGYNLEIRLAASPDRYAKGTSWPTVAVVRVDRYGGEVGRRAERAR
jgi:predicted XRE-type DNA-binding protein